MIYLIKRHHKTCEERRVITKIYLVTEMLDLQQSIQFKSKPINSKRKVTSVQYMVFTFYIKTQNNKQTSSGLTLFRALVKFSLNI